MDGTVQDCVFRGNTAGLAGGALICTSASLLDIKRTTFSGNRVTAGGGGALFLSSSVDLLRLRVEQVRAYGAVAVLWPHPA
jgi:predicted outer membrane repeat protein